jgi:type I restriction enzyme, S subunit
VSEPQALPAGWVETTLGDVISPTRNSFQHDSSTELSYIGLEHVESETMRLLGTMPAKELRSNALSFKTGDILYGRLRPYLNKVLQVGFDGLCSPEFIVFHEFNIIEPKYLQYFINSWPFKSFATHLNTGDRPRVDWDQLKGYHFPLAPLAEQRRIVSSIEQQFTRLDAGIASLRQAQTRLKRYRAAVLKAAVEGKLTEEWRAEHTDTEPADMLLARILSERRARWEEEQHAKGKDPAKMKYEEPVGPDTTGLPELPEGWCWATVEQLALVVRGASPRPAGDPKYFGGDIPWITVGSITSDEQPYLRSVSDYVTEAGRKASRYIEPETLLLTNSGATLGVPKITKIGGCINDGSVALLETNYPLKLYLYYYLSSITNKLRLINQGAAQPNLNTGIVKSIVVPIPPLKEQNVIIAEIEQQLSAAQVARSEISANLKRAERLRQCILREAFAGRLVSQDPDDEPANKLLEKIKSTKLYTTSIATSSVLRSAVMGKTKEHTIRRALYEVLRKTSHPIAPNLLFFEAGFTQEHIEDFYQELRKEILRGRIRELRPNDTEVLLQIEEVSINEID